MAIGDDAVNAGMPVLTGSEQADDIDLYINETRDIIARRTQRTSPNLDIWVQGAAPAHAPGRIWIKVNP